MRISNAQAVARPTYYDRNPLEKAFNYRASGVAPHGNTVRWQYTIPAGRKAFVEFLQIEMLRDAVATSAALASVLVNYTPSGGVLTNIFAMDNLTNALGDVRNAVSSQLGFAMPGAVIQVNSGDGSTGGTYTYQASSKITEYDA